MNRRSSFLILLLSAGALSGAERGLEIKLWPQGAPGSEGVTAAEVSKPSAAAINATLPGNFTVTHYPSIYVFLPPKEKATGAAMIVGPGGGHTQLVIEKEGWEIADWLNAQGIAAFVLKYRLARAPGSTYALDREVYADAARSIRLVRSRAAEWAVDPKRVGFIGFSAGGEVAGMVETRFDAGKPDAADPIERFSSRPDFNVLVYPASRPGTARPDPKAPAYPIAIEENKLFPVSKADPPAFLVCTDDDPSHVTATVKFYLELQAHGVPAEMRIYGYGTHGFAIRPTKRPGAPVETWTARLKDWLADRGISK